MCVYIYILYIRGTIINSPISRVLNTAQLISGAEVMSQDGPKQAQELMSSVAAPAPMATFRAWLGLWIMPQRHSTAFWAFEVQKVCYSHEGTLNKFLIDDKGMHWAQCIHHPALWK